MEGLNVEGLNVEGLYFFFFFFKRGWARIAH